jgi:hypothetical protein
MTSITSWLRAFFSVREHAAELRGLEEVDAGTSERRAWPRTTGSDVVAITAAVDPTVRTYRLRWGGHGIGRRWRVSVDDVERYAVPAPHDEYIKNPSFWSAIEAVSVFLHSVGAPVPNAATWKSLLDQLADPASSRHGGTMSTVDNWTQAYLELKARAESARGTVAIDDGASSVRWPCTTGADVIAIAALFYGYVNAIEPEVAGGVAVARRWRETMTSVERSALAAPDDVFVDNHVFWMTLASLCVFLESVNAALPERGPWKALLAQIGQPALAPPRDHGPFGQFDKIATYRDVYAAQLEFLLAKRGFDVLESPADHLFGYEGMKIPRATNADAIALASYWTNVLAKGTAYDGAAKRWEVIADIVERDAKAGKPDDIYAHNSELFRELPIVSTQITEGDGIPDVWDAAFEAIKDSVDTLEAGAKKLGEIVGDAARGVGKASSEVGKSVLAGFGTPLLIGAALLRLFRISRARGTEET